MFSSASADKGYFSYVQNNMWLIQKPDSCLYKNIFLCLFLCSKKYNNFLSIMFVLLLTVSHRKSGWTHLSLFMFFFSFMFTVRVGAWMVSTSGPPSARGRTPLGRRSFTTLTRYTNPSSSRRPGTQSKSSRPQVRHRIEAVGSLPDTVCQLIPFSEINYVNVIWLH